jgi:integrase/recombinase XerD
VEEVGRFLEAIPVGTAVGLRDRALFELLYSTGLRAGEASHLDLYDLDLAGGTLRVREGKGGKDRVVPVGRVAAEFLRRYIEEVRPLLVRAREGEVLFVTRLGTRLTTTMIDIECRRWREVARLPWLTPHALRHAAATHMLAAGADIRHVQELLGHAWITTTNLYTHVVIGDLLRVHRRTHPREARRR